MAKSFEAQLNDWSRKTQARTNATLKNACQMLVEEVQRTRGKGGNMPVDTGFLRNSGLAQIGSLPSGSSSPSNMTAAVLVINQIQPGDRFYFGWVANYAKYMEARYAFMRLAAQNWDNIVYALLRKPNRNMNHDQRRHSGGYL